jgi:mRNA interferase MazF
MEDFLKDEIKSKNFTRWAKLKAHIHFTRDSRVMRFHAREIWWASLGVNIGDEEDGKNCYFERPILIIKKFNQHLALSVPLSSRLKDNLYYYRFSFNNQFRSALLSQSRPLSSRRLIRRMGRINRADFLAIIAGIKNYF